MLEQLVCRASWLIALVMVTGCPGADDSAGGSSKEVVSNDGTCELRDGTYVFSYSQVTGDCGPLSDEVLVVQAGTGFAAGMASAVDCDESRSCSDQHLALSARCSVSLGGSELEARKVISFNVARGTGVLELRIVDPANAESCASTYSITASSLDGSAGASGTSQPTAGSSGNHEGGAGASGDSGGSPMLQNGESCLADADCESGECAASAAGDKFCYGNAPLGAFCSITQDCRGGVCIESECTDPQSLFANGSTCTASTECASGNCGTSVAGDRFCYGFAEVGDSCRVTQDCAAAICRAGTCALPGSCSSDTDCAPNAVCDDTAACHQVCGANAIASNGTCNCLPGFEWASTDPDDTNCVRPPTLSGCHIIGQDHEQTYLGEVGSCYGSTSVCNEFSSYGSEYASDSIFNDYGTFGSEFASYSAYNEFTSTPPLLVCDGVVEGCVTVNSFACSGNQIDPDSLCDCP